MAYRRPQDRGADVRRAYELKRQGLNVSQVALAMGIGRTTASDYLNYPDSGVLYRKRRRQFVMCPRCGGKMSYGAQRCARCRRS